MTPSRDDTVTTLTCPSCGVAFIPVRRQRFCGQPCRQRAYRRRHPTTTADIARATTAAPPQTRPRRDHTIYTCTECDQRYLAQQ
jgi:hypothetical protein